MARYFNGKEVELLAPAGNIEIFKEIVKANCDAIYIGGKSLNMRMIRKGFNFSNEEIAEAVQLAHLVDKKVYVTVNNLIHDFEIEEATTYLAFLESVHVDGIIVQDLGVLQICKENQFNIEIHSSVMMNVHNIAYVEALKEYGVSRVVLSREMDLKTAKHLQKQTGVETEYFMHGDMCTVNGSNCYFSSSVWGNSANRGRCFKPCRWPFRIKKDGMIYPTAYPLAAKDMYMYEHIPELIEAHVTSFKIEGRMRETDFIVDLVNTYGDAIDRYIQNPLGFDRKEQAQKLFENRKRDFTTSYAFGNPGLDFINTRYEGTGKFYSTGKVFSTPTEEPELTNHRLNTLQQELTGNDSSPINKRSLSVKVNNFEQAKLCIDLGVDRVYLASEVFLPDAPFTTKQLHNLFTSKNQTALYFALPQMMDELQFDQMDQFLKKYGILFDGLLISNLGALKRYGSLYNVITDFNVNIYNHKASKFYQQLGASEITASIETKADQLGAFIRTAACPVEMIVHGPLKVMYLDHNLYENTAALDPIDQEDNQYVPNHILTMVTDKGENPVYLDQNKKNHLVTAKEFCLLPLLNHLHFNQALRFRIEGQTYSTEQLKQLIKIYQTAIDDTSQADRLFSAMQSTRAGFTLGSLSYKYNIAKTTATK